MDAKTIVAVGKFGRIVESMTCIFLNPNGRPYVSVSKTFGYLLILKLDPRC